MTDEVKKLDPTRGKKYRARHNVSFGKTRPMVQAGEIFQLDDADLAKRLLAEGAISEDLEGKDDKQHHAKPGEATFTDPTKPPANVTKNAAEMAGDAADAAKKHK